MKRSKHGTRLQDTPKHKEPAEPAPETTLVPTPETGKHPRDARDDPEQLEENQQDLGVGEDHETDAMEEGGRGTFP